MRAGFVLLNAASGGGFVQIFVAGAEVETIRVNWGAPDPFFGLPAVVNYTATPPLTFLPDMIAARAFFDGTYTLMVRGFAGGVEVGRQGLGLFLDTANATGITRTGTGVWEAMGLGTGDDTAFGQGGSDLIVGGEGADSLHGGSGNDIIDGGWGHDTLFGASGHDAMDGGLGRDLLLGGAGEDTLFGGDEADTVAGGDGNDLVYGGEGDDRLTGSAGRDELLGEAGADTLVGGTGEDRFEGGAGADRLVTEADGVEDLFIYQRATDGDDVISGFELGVDKVSLPFLFSAGLDASRFVARAADMTDNGTWLIYDARGVLSVDANGTEAGGAEVIARLIGTPALEFTDLIFRL